MNSQTIPFISTPPTDARVLLRIDGNVPLNGTITDDYRLQAIRPTLDLLLSRNAHVLLVTHLGRPQEPNPALSTHVLLSWFDAHGYQIVFAQTIAQAEQLIKQHPLVLLENIRFWPGEMAHDHALATQLRAITDFYVNDAFGTMHRTDTSITILPRLYPPNQRVAGLLVQKELHLLNQLVDNPAHPFLMIIGGAKIETKLPLIEALFHIVDVIALLPALSNTFAHASGLPIGLSLYNVSLSAQARDLQQRAQKMGKTLVVPTDYLVARQTFAGTLRSCAANEVEKDEIIVSIGPQTIAQYQALMDHAKTIFCNGSAGDAAYPLTLEPMRTLLKHLCHVQALRVVAGGDCGALARTNNVTACIDLLSTGGGATLHYLTGIKLPGLQALTN